MRFRSFYFKTQILIRFIIVLIKKKKSKNKTQTFNIDSRPN